MSFARYPSLIDKVVFITGGGSGIGAAMVEAFAEQKANVAFVDIAVEPSKELVAKIGASHPPPLFLHCDLTDIAALETAMEEVRQRLGPIGVLDQQRRQRPAPGGGRNERRGLGSDDGAQSQAPVLRRPDRAPLHARAGRRRDRQFFLDRLDDRDRPDCRSIPPPRPPIVGLTNSLAREFGPDNIRVNAIAPGAVITERQRRLWMSEQDIADFRARQCINRTLLAEDVARLALFLSSDDSAMITKQCYQVDGGMR